MSKSSGGGMEDLMEKNTYNLAYGRKGKNTRHRTVSPDPKRQRRFLLLGGAGILLLVALIAISFRAGNRFSADALTSVEARVNQLGERLTPLEEVEDRMVLLEKQERGLQQSISKLDRSMRSMIEQLDKVAQEIELLQKRIPSIGAKSDTPRTVQRKPISQPKMRYHEVRTGDTLYLIAKTYVISVDELCRLNNLKQSDIIYPDHLSITDPV